jgi:two-component system, chemotaxis family, response regulator Rcp1
VLSLFGSAVTESQAGWQGSGAAINRGVRSAAVYVAGGGVSLKHASVVRTVRILVIEDNGSDVFLLDRALKKQDLQFELVHVLDGGEALAFIRRQGAYADGPIPNLILVDLNLRRYTGEDIVREIRSARHLGGVPVCVWSSSRSRRDQALLKDLGVSQFITKPSGLDQFMEIGRIIKDLLALPRESPTRLAAMT